MEGWSLGLSIVAILIASGSALFTWQQKEVEKKALVLEKQRHAEELRPGLAAEVEEVFEGDTNWDQLHLRLLTPWELTNVQLTIESGAGISFTGSQFGVDPAAPYPILNAEGGPLRADRDLTWRVQLEKDRESTARISVDCVDATERRWRVVIEVDLPYNVLNSIH